MQPPFAPSVALFKVGQIHRANDYRAFGERQQAVREKTLVVNVDRKQSAQRRTRTSLSKRTVKYRLPMNGVVCSYSAVTMKPLLSAVTLIS